MALDSEATFEERVYDLQLEAHLEHFKQIGWRTLHDLVYDTTYSPQGGSEETFQEEIIVKGLGSANHTDRPRLRRLYFEAFVVSAADLRRKG